MFCIGFNKLLLDIEYGWCFIYNEYIKVLQKGIYFYIVNIFDMVRYFKRQFV